MPRLAERLRLLVAMALAHFINDTPIALLPALLPFIVDEFSLNFLEAGGLVAALIVSLSISQVASGYAADRIDKFRLLSVALISLGVICVLAYFTSGYIHLLILQIAIGVSASTFHPIGYSTLADIFEGRGRAKALSLGSASGDLSAPIVFASSGALLIFLGWRDLYLLWGFVILGVAVIGVPKRMSGVRIKPPAKRPIGRILASLAPLIFIMLLTSASYRLLTSFAHLSLIEMGVDASLADAFVAFALALGIPGALLAGWLSERIGEQATMILALSATAIISAVLSISTSPYISAPLISSMGLPLIGVWPSFYSYAAKISYAGGRGLTYGLLLAVVWGAGSTFTLLGGALSDIFTVRINYPLIAILTSISAIATYRMLKP